MKKKVDPEVFMTYLEDVRERLKPINSKMTDEWFIVHVLNNLTSDYHNQIKN
jgi:hypothetical protein